jgi:hypothetical protein
MSAIASAIVAHKFLVALAIASLTVTGGAIGVATSANTFGTMSYAVNSSINVVSIAKMNFGNLTAGQSKTFSTTAKVDIASDGNYSLFLENAQILYNTFSSFNVNVSGLASNTITLSMDHPWERFNASSGMHVVTVTVGLTVESEVGNTFSVSNAPFLGISVYPPYHIEPIHPVAAHNEDDQGDDFGN